MNEIKCPNCKKMFRIDEKDYNSIVKQIRDKEFEDELSKKEKEFSKEKSTELKLLEKDLTLKNNISLSNKDKEIDMLKNDLEKKELEVSKKFDKELVEKDKEIQQLKNDLKQKESEHELKLKEIVQEKIDEINQLSNKLELNEKEYQLKEQGLKDNDSKTGSKGDFIFRDYSEDGIEYISIMFEMKNELDETATKHKNEDFFKELDKDRREKNCEYAVLVSLLEKDNEIYNTGIVDVSYKYEKMYVIRPQAFIAIINILRGAAQKSLEAKRQLIEIQSQNIDISNFEENMNNFKDAFGKNYRVASEKFLKAIEEIDKSIDHLQKIKANLMSSENNLRLANNKAEDLSIKKLTANAPSIAAKFEELGVEVKKSRKKKAKTDVE